MGATAGTTPAASAVSTGTGAAEHPPAVKVSGELANWSRVGVARQAEGGQAGSAQPISPLQLKSVASEHCSGAPGCTRALASLQSAPPGGAAKPSPSASAAAGGGSIARSTWVTPEGGKVPELRSPSPLKTSGSAQALPNIGRAVRKTFCGSWPL